MDWTSPKLYVLMVANISVSLAFYGLLSFYHTTEKGRVASPGIMVVYKLFCLT